MPNTPIEELLPAGSVVRNYDSEKDLMIIGILAVDESTGKEYDYLAVPYPEGYISSEYLYLCNQDDIAEIQFLGFANKDFQVFRYSMLEAGINDDQQDS